MFHGGGPSADLRPGRGRGNGPKAGDSVALAAMGVREQKLRTTLVFDPKHCQEQGGFLADSAEDALTRCVFTLRENAIAETGEMVALIGRYGATQVGGFAFQPGKVWLWQAGTKSGQTLEEAGLAEARNVSRPQSSAPPRIQNALRR